MFVVSVRVIPKIGKLFSSSSLSWIWFLANVINMNMIAIHAKHPHALGRVSLHISPLPHLSHLTSHIAHLASRISQPLLRT